MDGRMSFLTLAKHAQQQQKLKDDEKYKMDLLPDENENDKLLVTSEKEKAKICNRKSNGIVNEMFEDSFGSMDTPRSKRTHMSIERMGEYTKLNRTDNSSCSRSSSESTKLYNEQRRGTIFSRINSVETRTAMKSALRTKFRKIAEERLTVRQIFQRYVEDSTLHGFRYTCTDTYIIRRVIWAILMILGAIYFIIKLKEGVVEYLEYPFSTLSTVDYAEELTFPAISICPINNMKIQNIKNNSKLKELHHQSRLPLHNNWTEPEFEIPGEEYYKMMYDSSWKVNELFEDCDWIKRDTNHPQMIPNICGPQNFTEYMNMHGQLCYTVNPGTTKHPLLSVTQSGILHGYEFMFDLRVNESLNLEHYTGLHVVVHDQNAPPQMEQGFSVSAGFKTFIAMDVTETTNLPPPYGTECGEKQLKYFDTYNQKACLLEYLTDHATSKCGCRETFMPDNGYPLCSLKESTVCMLPAKGSSGADSKCCRLQRWSVRPRKKVCFKTLTSKSESFNEYEVRRDCPIDCTTTSYSVRLSDARYIHDPPKGIEPILMQRKAWSRGKDDTHLMKLVREMNRTQLDQYVQDNIIIMLFYFREMEKSIAEQEATFDFYQFLGDMGGEIGLMLGASLLTFVEFVDLFWFLAYHQLLRFHKSHRGKKQQDEGSLAEDVIAEEI